MSKQNVLKNLINSLAILPGIGDKSATRMALFLLNCPREKALELSRNIVEAREKISYCSDCFNFSDSDRCYLCSNPQRDGAVICVVETPGDVISIERTGVFKGKYHVLHGVIAPLEGIGPDQLKIKELIRRVQHATVEEIIISTNPTMNGNATAMYISEQLNGLDVRITRIAQGIPAGGDIGYSDNLTLKNALDCRYEIKRS